MAYATINKPSNYFDTLLWTGNNSSTRNITGLNFQPDLSFKKERNASFSIGNMWYDSIRGLGLNKHLISSSTDAEGAGNDDLYGYYTGFISGGFSVTAGSSGSDYVNNSSYNYVAWNWLANGAGVSNTQGSITSTVSANTTSGFSIVTRTGTGSVGTVGHGLGSIPKMIITKKISAVDNWGVYHASLGATKYLVLNLTDASGTSTSPFNNTEPTSSVFTVGTGSTWNASSATFVDYCFAEVKGFSKFGSYTGNGSTDGAFVYTGFKPAFVIIKRDFAGYNWLMFDNKRQNTFNTIDDFLYADLSDAEVTGNANQAIDFVSNGFKCRGTGGSTNGSGGTFIYMAFAENPLVGTNNIPATAR